jgi:hypothetical protein
MGALCRSFPAKDLSEACFAGIGVPTDWFEQFNPKKIVAGCTTASANVEERFLCIAEGARNFRVNGMPYEEVCSRMGLSAEETDRCNTLVRNDNHTNISIEMLSGTSLFGK